jgi:hypothetical protein
MAMFSEEARRANHHVKAVNASLDSELGIAHITANILWGVRR